ncbi:unnamed protein product [Soboliphyme baturini]|uniref:PAP-associated domain-containing protein n=1 Tax=Soboliphyme baturini TaxID=241478 RepID=A0A183IHQ3_9BILA|nr:unnamed protein product [Soboliphyme baturini]
MQVCLMFQLASSTSVNLSSRIALSNIIFQLSKDIFQHYIRNHQSNVQLRAKLQLRDILQKTVATVFPSSGLYIVGSSLNGFGSRRSDMDLCLMLTSKALRLSKEMVYCDKLIQILIRFVAEIVQNQQLIEAKVPILRLKFRGPFEDISVDLNVNNSVGIKNTHLLYYYSNWDWRVKPLVLTIKEWARQQGINDASQSTLSSYSLVLMILHYLQCKIYLSFPNLVRQFCPHYKSCIRVFVTFNVQSLGELFLGFLEYYAFIFNFEEDAISVRCGSKIPRGIAASCNPLLNYPSSWKCLYIEGTLMMEPACLSLVFLEPFTLSNTAYSVYNEHVFSLVKQTFVRSFEVLRYRRRMSIVIRSRNSKRTGYHSKGNYDRTNCLVSQRLQNRAVSSSGPP